MILVPVAEAISESGAAGSESTDRPSQALGGRTPDQAWRGEDPPEARIIRARDAQPGIRIVRHRYGDDPRLPMLEIEIDWPEAA